MLRLIGTKLVAALFGWLWLLAACFDSSAAAAVAEGARRPNVVLFLVDDMGFMDCGVNGSKYYRTPNIDRFAERAMRFTDAYAQPLCSPTRASILSGKYSARHGITSATGHQPPRPTDYAYLPQRAGPTQPLLTPESKNYLDPSEYTLAEALHDLGYRTAHIGKWHLGLTEPHWPEQQGFDEAFHCHPDPGPPGEYFSPYGVTHDGKPSAQHRVGTITDGPAGEYIVDRQAQEARRFIEANKDRPFFLNLWCYGVHGPWGHKKEYTEEFAKTTNPRGAQGNPIMASMLRSVDECFGTIVDTIDRLGLAENTIVVFYSDNGGNTHSNVPDDPKFMRAAKQNEAFIADWRKWAGDRPPTNNAPLRDGKGTLYEGGTRVPMMWAWAGRIKPNTTSNAVVGHIDIYPTVLELVGADLPQRQKLDGVSLVNVLSDEGNLNRQAFFNYFPHGRSPGKAGGVWVRSGDWKLIRWFGAVDEAARHELYNLAQDLGESTNLASAEPARVAELDAMIDTFLKETGATYPRPNPAFKPTAAAAPRKPADPNAPPMIEGLAPKQCKASIVESDDHNGALRVEGTGRKPFLGTTRVKSTGPTRILMRARAPGGGTFQAQWRTVDQDTFPAEGQIVSVEVPASDEIQDAELKLPVEGTLVHLRLYVPAEKTPVDIDALGIYGRDPKKPLAQWTFPSAKPAGN